MTNTKVISDKVFESLENQKDNITPSDFHFYNLGHLPILAKRLETSDKTCQSCKKNLESLLAHAETITEILNNKSRRKAFDSFKTKLEQHLKEEHGYTYPGHFMALYSLWGTLTGITLGFILSLVLFYETHFDTIIISASLFLIGSAILGKRKDKKQFVKNKLL